MALGSRLLAAHDGIVTALQAYAPLAGVTVSESHPGEHVQREHIWIDGISFTAQPKALKAGTNPRRQQITVGLSVRVFQEGDDAGAVRTRCAALTDFVEEALRADMNLGGAVDFGGVGEGALESGMYQEGRVCAVALEAVYTATKG